MRYKTKRRQDPERAAKVIALLGVCTVVILGALLVAELLKEKFRTNTFIEGVDCSRLTVEESVNKLQETISQSEITFKFVGDVTYQTTGEQFEATLAPDYETAKANIQDFWAIQKESEQQKEYHYFIENVIQVSEERIRQYLSSISELQKENMVQPQSAYLEWKEEDRLAICPEIYGTEIDFEDAVSFTLQKLVEGKKEIDFTSITNSKPEILSTNQALQETREQINAALKTTIHFELYDGSVYTLDKERIKSWIVQDEAGNFTMNLEENLTTFLEELNEAASKANSKVVFQPTELEERILPVPKNLRAKVDVEKEMVLIQEEMKTSGTYTREPIYSRIFDTRNLLSYVEIDLTRQRVLMYYMGECVVDTPCVTGNVKRGDSTPPGLFYLSYKTRNATLMNNSFVKYWMPFNGGIGLHDASWRSKFGGDIYKTNGSHGCVNLPEGAAKLIYEHIDKSMPIIVY